MQLHTVRSLRYSTGADTCLLQPNVSPDEVALKGQPALDPVEDRATRLGPGRGPGGAIYDPPAPMQENQHIKYLKNQRSRLCEEFTG
ncbi:hypothetical protein QE152_g40503 [Popillia japonica]|uniref:Uncharacterized protein n=1 Tax=Popillia japonica TaxID=7064 RepID=A0AAW1HFT0_POPJA